AALRRARRDRPGAGRRRAPRASWPLPAGPAAARLAPAAPGVRGSYGGRQAGGHVRRRRGPRGERRPMNDERAHEMVEHLQAAAVELIEAARAFLDVAEDMVKDPGQALAMASAAAKVAGTHGGPP